jgi:hypothetical protein
VLVGERGEGGREEGKTVCSWNRPWGPSLKRGRERKIVYDSLCVRFEQEGEGGGR